MDKWYTVYAKVNDWKTFKAFDFSTYAPAQKLIYASQLQNTRENQKKLQDLADQNKNLGLQLQLRYKDKIIFQTK